MENDNLTTHDLLQMMAVENAKLSDRIEKLAKLLSRMLSIAETQYEMQMVEYLKEIAEFNERNNQEPITYFTTKPRN